MVWKSFRNIAGVTVRRAVDVCAHDVVAGGLLIAQSGALDALAQRVGLNGGADTEGGAS